MGEQSKAILPLISFVLSMGYAIFCARVLVRKRYTEQLDACRRMVIIAQMSGTDKTNPSLVETMTREILTTPESVDFYGTCSFFGALVGAIGCILSLLTILEPVAAFRVYLISAPYLFVIHFAAGWIAAKSHYAKLMRM